MTNLKTLLLARAKLPVVVVAAASSLAACVSPVAGPSGLYASPIGTAPVTSNPTGYSQALVCLGGYARQNGIGAPRIAVGRIADYTGKAESDGSGRKLTQAAASRALGRPRGGSTGSQLALAGA